MPSFSGQFEAQNPSGAVTQSGSCQVTFDDETFTLTPGSGPPLAIDLGDIDVFTPGDYDLALTLYTRQKLLLRQFGKSFQNLAHDLLEAYRQRLVKCLLLEDLSEVERFEGHAQLDSPSSSQRSFSSPAEIRLYRSNLAVLPTQATGVQWRLAEIDRVTFDEAAYALTLHSGAATLRLTKLAKRTRELHERVENGIAKISEKSAQALHRLLSFLTPGEFQQAAALLREGQPASFASLNGINAKVERALYENIVDEQLKPYCDSLRSSARSGSVYTGFKFIRGEEGESETAADESAKVGEENGAPSKTDTAADKSAKTTDEEEDQILHWFFFPLANPAGCSANLVAWEPASRGGRATYFFRLVPPDQSRLLADPTRGPAALDAAIRQLNRALVLLNFRREPIYLSDEKLETEPRYRRYSIACRKLPELGRLRSSFVGRALHTSPDAWQKQVDGFLSES